MVLPSFPRPCQTVLLFIDGLTPGSGLKPQAYSVVLGKVHPLYEPKYVVPCVGNLAERKSHVLCLNFAPAHEYRKYVESRI
jgi:hypothetical protein